MNTAEIKIELFRKLDSLESSNLQEAYGLLLNYINSKRPITEWDELSKEEQDALILGLKQLDDGEGRNHRNVMADIRKKYLND